ncbi:ABC transporter permease [Priestia endophytica]|jgi:NitT/TauT family transport system permease protein|uniref:ABC transporter permease n=2 Tax=Priestia endophytica TaxID=135735 RepID=A0AAX1QC34_9BACI|nr:ABC transporter permease subunit [Priestia endophytica]KYG35671.1 ABC transporter permease [Priestia endophytica]MBG9814619.1 ABC transporter permease [Priestia endophytica]MCM3539181.1 ABC transporter permease subunit [Priestia endophytica]RAS76840.1 ABC transporter permease [Priestia endophytica]RAS79599.1 ABC transporter permease [Priestia endophytica]
MRKFLSTYSYSIAIAFALIGLWIYITNFTDWLSPLIFPSPHLVAAAFFRAIFELFQGFLSSMKLLVPSVLLALVLGIGGGLFFGMRPKPRKILTPFFNAFSPLPLTLFIPYAIALLPTFELASMSILFIAAFWPIFLGTIQGVLLIDHHYWDNAKTIGLEKRDLIFKVIIPASSPLILNGIGQSLSLCFLVLMTAEMFGAKAGMGYFIQYYTDFTQYDLVISGLIFNSLVILIIMITFERIKKRILFWTNLKNEAG